MDKELYKQKIHQLVEKLKENNDVDLLDYLQEEIGIYSDDKINHIYEYCIERIIGKQACEFYADFPMREIVSSLRNDFVRMEKFRRNDNFTDFCLAVYQQIECMTNAICKNSTLSNAVDRLWSCAAYVKHWDEKSQTSIKTLDIANRSSGDYCIAKLVLVSTTTESYIEKSKRSLQSQYAMDKIRIVLYYLGYHAMMKSTDYDTYTEIANTLYALYQCRNLNHRGNQPLESAKEILDNVLAHKSYYYFKFMGILAQYVNFIKDGMAYLPMLNDFAQKYECKPLRQQLKVVGKIELDPRDTSRHFNKK